MCEERECFSLDQRVTTVFTSHVPKVDTKLVIVQGRHRLKMYLPRSPPPQPSLPADDGLQCRVQTNTSSIRNPVPERDCGTKAPYLMSFVSWLCRRSPAKLPSAGWRLRWCQKLKKQKQSNNNRHPFCGLQSDGSWCTDEETG